MSRKPLHLQRNVRYPTYQLYAMAENKQLSDQDIFKILILETYEWLRMRFSSSLLPPQLDVLPAKRYQEVRTKSITSFSMRESYHLDVFVLWEQGVFAMQLVEPDLGSGAGAKQQARPATPGRQFETNVSFRITKQGVQCGFNTYCIEPEHTKMPCEVYRLHLIKKIVAGSLLSLKHEVFIRDRAIHLNSLMRLEKFKETLESETRQLPIVLYSDKQMVLSTPKADLTATRLSLEANIVMSSPPILTTAHPMDDAAKRLWGYALFYRLNFGQLETFRRLFPDLKSFDYGDIYFIPPTCFQETPALYQPNSLLRCDLNLYQGISYGIQCYPKHKAIDYHELLWLEDAQALMLQQQKQETVTNVKKVEQDRAAQQWKSYYAQQVEELKGTIKGLKDENEKLKLHKGLHAKEKAAIIQQHQQDLTTLQTQLQAKFEVQEQELERLRFLLEKPKAKEDLVDWIERRYKDEIVLHEKAIRVLEQTPKEHVHLDLLCDALDYLATCYRDYLLQESSYEDCLQQAAQRYNHHFQVSYNSKQSIGSYPSSYKLRYTPKDGVRKEFALDQHLLSGVDTKALTRIYFFFEPTTEKIVIGALPSHLPTISQH